MKSDPSYQSRTLSGGGLMVRLRPPATFFEECHSISGELMVSACRATMTSASNAALSPNASMIVIWEVRRPLRHSRQIYIHSRMTVLRHLARSTTLKCVPYGPSLHLVKHLTRTVPCPTQRFSPDMASYSPKMNMTPSEWCSTRYRQ